MCCINLGREGMGIGAKLGTRYTTVFGSRIRMTRKCLGLQDPSINKQKNKKNLDFYSFVTSQLFLKIFFEDGCKCTVHTVSTVLKKKA
jgi:hypothetical protein